MNLGIDISTHKNITLTTDAVRRHIYVVGKSGTGKSVLLEHIALSLIEEGFGVCVFDPHGDLAEKIADTVPFERTQMATYWEPWRLDSTLGYNPLKEVPTESRPLTTENVLSAFSHVWQLSNQTTPRLLHILRNSIRLLLDNPGASLIDLQRLLTDAHYRRSLLHHSTDQTVTAFWRQEFDVWNDRQRAEYIASLQNKVGVLVSNPATRNILAHSTFRPGRSMERGEIIIVNLSKGKLGEESASLLGALLTSGFAQAAHERAAIPEESRRDFVLIIDEFQNFTTTAFAGILSEARKYRLGLVLAHQFLSQVPEFLRDAVIGTANTLICFRIGARDAPLLAAELDLDNPRRLKNLPDHQALVRTPQMPDVRQLVTHQPRKPGGRIEAVKRRTKARLTKP